MKFRYVLLTFFVLCGVFSAQAQTLVIYAGVFLRLLYLSYGSYNKKGEWT